MNKMAMFLTIVGAATLAWAFLQLTEVLDG